MRLIVYWLASGSVALGIASGCGGQKPPEPGVSRVAQQNSESGEVAAAPNDVPSGSVSPKDIALQFVPAQATAVLLKDHQALREFGLPFFLDAARGFDGRMGESFSDREIELSLLATLGEADGQRGVDYFACLQLAPDATVQRLVNAWKLQPDNKTYPGFACYRGNAEGQQPVLVAQRQAIIAIGPEGMLKPRLAASPPPGPVGKRMQPLAADHDLILCCLADYRDLAIADGYLQPLFNVVEPWLVELPSLPPGACNAVTFALRLRNAPELLVRAEAADSSLAAEMGEVFERSAAKLKTDFAAIRADLKSALPAGGADEIDSFLGQAVEGLAVRRNGQEIDVALPLGKDGAAFKRFVELVQQDLGLSFERALRSAEKATKLRNPREQLREVAIAFLNHEDAYQRLPTNISAEEKPLLSWRVALLPYLEQGELFKKFKLDEPWDSEHNHALLDRIPQIYRDPRVADKTRTTFQIFMGDGAAFEGKPLRRRMILDGIYTTLSVVQSPAEKAVPWTKPQDLPFILADPSRALGTIPAEGIFAAMFDGTVYQLPADYPNDSWRRLIQPNDGETVELPRQ